MQEQHSQCCSGLYLRDRSNCKNNTNMELEWEGSRPCSSSRLRASGGSPQAVRHGAQVGRETAGPCFSVLLLKSRAQYIQALDLNMNSAPGCYHPAQTVNTPEITSIPLKLETAAGLHAKIIFSHPEGCTEEPAWRVMTWHAGSRSQRWLTDTSIILLFFSVSQNITHIDIWTI